MSRKRLWLWAMLLWASMGMMAQRAEVEQDMFESMREGDKAAVVAVHAGAADALGRQCLDRFNARMREAFPTCDFREAWTSREQIRQWESDGVGFMPTVDALLVQLQKEGYTHVLIQSSDIVDGVEMQYLRQVAEGARRLFKQLRVGEPLLSDAGDYAEVANAVTAAYGKAKEANVLACPETAGEANAQFAMLDYTLRDKDLTGWYVGTTEGYPSFDSVARQLKRQKAKKVNVIPFVFTTAEDVAEDWRQRLQKAGYKASAELHALGELDAILDIFVRHIRHAEKYRTLSAKEQKWMLR